MAMDANTKYNRKFLGLDGNHVNLDYYRIIAAFPELAEEVKHAIKKQLFLGVRDKASAEQDLDEAILSLQKYKERLAQERAISESVNAKFNANSSMPKPQFQPIPNGVCCVVPESPIVMIRDLEPQFETLRSL